jgi:hypothetical protein
MSGLAGALFGSTARQDFDCHVRWQRRVLGGIILARGLAGKRLCKSDQLALCLEDDFGP